MELQKIACAFSICKIDHIEQVDFTQEFVFLSRTPDEISLVCQTDHMPPGVLAANSGWKVLKVAGVLDFGMIGVVAKISNLLAEAEISIFVVSTYNTDYIFLNMEHFDRGIQILARNGYVIKWAIDLFNLEDSTGVWNSKYIQIFYLP